MVESVDVTPSLVSEGESVTDAPTPKRAPRKRASKGAKGVPASVLTQARNAHNGATLARAFGLDPKRSRDVMRAKGYYPMYPDRTLPKYKSKGVPTFSLVRADAIQWLSAMYVRKHAK